VRREVAAHEEVGRLAFGVFGEAGAIDDAAHGAFLADETVGLGRGDLATDAVAAGLRAGGRGENEAGDGGGAEQDGAHNGFLSVE
jgi:hypothetical protein